MSIYILLASILVMLASLVGVAFTNRFFEKYAAYLLTFSSGVFAIITFNLIHEAIEHADSLAYALCFVIAGICILALTDIFIPEGHSHHSEEDNCGHSHAKIDARKMLLGDTIHNTGDGIVLASAFLINPILGIGTAAGILVHELIQEISEFFILRQAGYTKKQALGWNFITSSTILIGAFGTYALASFEMLEVPLIGIAAGAFAYIVLKDLIPNSIRNSIQEKKYVKHILVFTIGVLLILLSSLIAGSH